MVVAERDASSSTHGQPRATRGRAPLSSRRCWLAIRPPPAPRPLPGAESEVAAASHAVSNAMKMLTGRAATKERFLAMAPAFDVVHFGGHAFVNPEFPLLSRLVIRRRGRR